MFDAADDDRGDDREHDAGRGRPVDRPELDDPHDARRRRPAGRTAANADEDDAPRRDAEDGGRLRIAADRVDLAAERASSAGRPTPIDDHDDRDDDEDRDARGSSSRAASVNPGGRPASGTWWLPAIR